MKAPVIDYFKINSIKNIKKKYYQFKTIETEITSMNSFSVLTIIQIPRLENEL